MTRTLRILILAAVALVMSRDIHRAFHSVAATWAKAVRVMEVRAK